jgi:hypothetical protein
MSNYLIEEVPNPLRHTTELVDVIDKQVALICDLCPDCGDCSFAKEPVAKDRCVKVKKMVIYMEGP